MDPNNNYYYTNAQQSYQNTQQPAYNNTPPAYYPAYDPTSEVLSIGQYILILFVSSIPVVNLICWIVWLCSSSTNKNKKNFLIANIVWWVILFVLAFIAGIVLTALGIGTAAAFM